LSTLEQIAPLLEELRAHPSLRERRPGHFFLGCQEVLHFHDDPSGIFADLRLGGGFVRFCVTCAEEQLELLGRIEECLAAIEDRETERGRQSRRS
jgi:hypothetical protein